MPTTEQARDILLSIWPKVTKQTKIQPAEMQLVLAIFRAESGYGQWRAGSAMEDSKNWGAIHCPNKGSDCSPGAQKGKTCALYVDSMDGTAKTRYEQCFRVYASHEEGAADALRHLYEYRPSLPGALVTGDALLVAHLMKMTHYHTMPSRAYALGLYNNAVEIAERLNEPLYVTLPPCPACGAGAGEACEPGCKKPGPVIQQGPLVPIPGPGAPQPPPPGMPAPAPQTPFPGPSGPPGMPRAPTVQASREEAEEGGGGSALPLVLSIGAMGVMALVRR